MTFKEWWLQKSIASCYAVYGSDDKDNEENNQFSVATPWGELKMQVDNPAAKDFFKEGKEYYVDFSEADD